MAVIRDVNLDTTSDNIIFIGAIGGLCLIVAVLGIKLKWFKHRMTLNDLPTTSIPTSSSDGMEPKIIRATFRPSSDFDNYVEVTPPKVLPPVRVHKSARNAISLTPRKRLAPDVPTLRISHTNDTNEIEPLQTTPSSEHIWDNLFVEERRKSTPPPPLPISPPPDDHEERLLLSLEANNNYNYTESDTIKLKEVQNIRESVLPSPPPYQENDPLAHIHYKKFTKKKISPLPSPHAIQAASLDQTEHEIPSTTEQSLDSLSMSKGENYEKKQTSLYRVPTPPRKKSFDTSPALSPTSTTPSPKGGKLEKKNSFLHQVPTPTEIPKLAFDFPSGSTPNLSKPISEPLLKTTQSTHSLATDQPKVNEKKGLFGYFGLKLGSKTENDEERKKAEKKQPQAVPKIEKQKVKKIRVLKSEMKENAPKVKENKNARLVLANVQSNEPIRQSQANMKAEQPTLEIMENRMEIDYFQKVKKTKSNRVPIIVKSPKADLKFEEKPLKTEVFRHEETFSAANGPLKVKKKKNKATSENTAIVAVSNPIETSYQKKSPSSSTNDGVPIPKPRVILKLEGFDDNIREIEKDKKPRHDVITPVISSPSSPSDTEDTWNLVAKHRLNTRAITATAISVRQKSDSEETTNSSILQMKQLELLNKPKTMREMKREQEEMKSTMINFGGKEDKESDTEA